MPWSTRLLIKPCDLHSGLLPDPSSSRSAPSSSTSVGPDEKDQRSASLLILQLLYTLTQAALASIKMELDLLASAPLEPVSAMPNKPQDDPTWRLDRPANGQTKPRQLVSGGGRVLRPFTILPSTTAMSDRERLRSEVFRSSHRLPTMTIDEYLEEERARGNIITGGG